MLSVRRFYVFLTTFYIFYRYPILGSGRTRSSRVSSTTSNIKAIKQNSQKYDFGKLGDFIESGPEFDPGEEVYGSTRKRRKLALSDDDDVEEEENESESEEEEEEFVRTKPILGNLQPVVVLKRN